MKWAVIAALVISILGSTVLMGLPGAALLEFSQTLLNPLNLHLKCLVGDAAWPSAILATAIWPASIPIAYFITYRKIKSGNKPLQIAIMVLILFAGAVIVTSIIESLCRSS